ncbi:MAG: molybdenum ABC transporter permease, partial [Chloroflexi bacterium]|nr:molybdenum ABC transporter permease [Chloroflexota bacterium]
SLPLAWRSILSGSLLMWARAVSEFGAVLILAYYVPFLGETSVTAPILVANRFTSFGLADARPVAVLVMLISLVLFVILRTVAAKGDKA